jgi:hypothetical protein
LQSAPIFEIAGLARPGLIIEIKAVAYSPREKSGQR